MGYKWPEQAKQIKGFLLFEMAAMSWESPTIQSTTELLVSKAETKCPVPSVEEKCPKCTHTLPFYREHDVTLMRYTRMSWTQWQESLWLAEVDPALNGK